MALTRTQKEEQLQELIDKMQKASSVVFAHYIGMTVADVSDLRDKLRAQKAEMKVAKKTLMKLAAKKAGLPDIEDGMIDGPVACIFSFDDPLTGAQAAFAFAKDHQQVELIGGIYDGKILSKADAVSLAKMPGRQQLLGIFMGMLQSPLRSFMSMSVGPLTGFARAASELAKKGGIAPAPAQTAAPAADTTPAASAGEPTIEAGPAEGAPAAEPSAESPQS